MEMEQLVFWGSCLTVLAIVFGIIWLKTLEELPPGPWGLPIVGYLPWIDPKEPQETLAQLTAVYGKIFSFRMGSLFTVVLTDPGLIRETLAKDVFTDRADLFLTHGIMDGNGIIAAQGSKWKEQRRFLSSFLKSAGMLKIGAKRDLMQKRILSGVAEACRMLAKNESKPIDPLKVLIHTMGNVLNELLFGITYEEDDPQWLYLQELAVEGVKLMGVAGPLNFLPFLRFFPPYRKTIQYILHGKRKTHEEYKAISQRQNGKEIEENGENLLAVFKREIGKSENFNEEQMYHILADMFGAGVETSLTTLRWFLLYMAAYPTLQDEVYKELSTVMADRDVPDLGDFSKTPFIEACITETLRIRPVVPLGIPHGAREDSEIGGYRIPKGTMILIPQYVLHTRPKVWERPHIFDPYRFIDSTTGKINKSNDHFMPFQCGKRACLGDEMARMLLFLFGAGILRRFRVALEGNFDNGARLEELLKGENGITWAPKEHELIFTTR